MYEAAKCIFQKNYGFLIAFLHVQELSIELLVFCVFPTAFYRSAHLCFCVCSLLYIFPRCCRFLCVFPETGSGLILYFSYFKPVSASLTYRAGVGGRATTSRKRQTTGLRPGVLKTSCSPMMCGCRRACMAATSCCSPFRRDATRALPTRFESCPGNWHLAGRSVPGTLTASCDEGWLTI